VENGDSGGPIFNQNGLVSIIASYEYPEGSDPNKGTTSGPCATRIADFIRSLTESPSLPPAPIPKPDKPIPSGPHQHKELDELSEGLEEALAKITKLEELLTNLPQGGDCKDLAIKVKSLTETVDRNKLEIDKTRQRIDALEQRMKDNALGIQRIVGVVEIVQKEVIDQKKRIGELDQKSKDVILRIQRLETSAATLSTSINQNTDKLKGKLHFRLRVDQTGRVIGVESQ